VPKPRVKKLTKPIEHGTYNGAQAHYRMGESPCGPCRLAKSEYQLEPNRVYKRKVAEGNRERRMTQRKAVAELVRRHNEEYLEILRALTSR